MSSLLLLDLLDTYLLGIWSPPIECERRTEEEGEEEEDDDDDQPSAHPNLEHTVAQHVAITLE